MLPDVLRTLQALGNGLHEIVSTRGEDVCLAGIAPGGTERGRSLESSHTPKIVPVIVIVGAKMLGAEPGWQQASMQLSVPAAVRFRCSQRAPCTIACCQAGGHATGEGTETLKAPQGLAIGVPFAILGIENPVFVCRPGKVSSTVSALWRSPAQSKACTMKAASRNQNRL